jgi:flagellar protein FliS
MQTMVHPGRAAQHYLQTQVRSSSPLELVVLLYDAALRSTAAALDAMIRKDIRARREAMSKALAIVSELQSTLNMDQGGDVAVQLDSLYSWMTESLVRSMVEQNPTPLQDVRKVLQTLRDAWNQIATAGPAAPESAA